ncbi:MAG: BspA family leucine-rich repeat surface protein [Lachnospiraceae bacterium]
MRKGFGKKKQVMAGFLSAVLWISSLPYSNMYVYAAEQVEHLQTEEGTKVSTESETAETVQLSTENEEMTDISTESETTEMIDSSVETETAKDNENVEMQDTEEKTDKEETEEKTDLQNTDSEETETEKVTETQEESVETEELIEFESENEGQETDLQEKIVTAELIGAYQFGDAPSERTYVSDFSSSLAADIDTLEMEEYLYQQMKKCEETINVQKYNISKDKIGDIVFGVINENPDLYFVKKKFSYSLSGSTVVSVMLTYDDSYDDNAFVDATREALAVVKPEMSDLEKAVVLHDYLAVNCEYDKENLDKGKVPDVSYTAYGTLVNRISVCEGYALAYKYLLNQAGIECLMVKSEAMNHAWNLIQLNGKYYQVDVTWDDPTWDLIGRARHKYMFRSDTAFVNNCEHHDWIVTEGSEVVDYKATDTSYDNAFWLKCNAPLVFVEEDCYYVTYNGTGVINKNSLSDITGDGTTVCDIGTWTVWNGSGFWQNAFSGLFYVNGRLYYNDKSSIRSFTLDDMGNAIDQREEFKADTANGYIYGSAFCQGKVYYSLHQSPNESAKETVLTADITFETEDPTEIPVEKIELDKETVMLAVGDKTVLKAAITPSYATDTAITWESSDNLIAEVSDGVITAIMAGSCTITASAGGKKAFCEVTIIDNEDVIASGSYENITWKIEKNGKLTVIGTGDFSDSNGYSRAPWYDSREYITSAEINVTGMTDASAMLYHCENLTSVDVSCFDTKNVTDMSQMFKGCGKLSNVDVSKFDTANVTNMEGMFANCDSLESLDVSGFHTEKVTSMWEMFKGCSSLTSLDLDNFDTGNVTDIHGMFGDCNSLKTLDLSNFDAGKVTNIKDIFSGCTGLSMIYTPINLTISAELPTDGEDIWYQPDGTSITELPQNLNYSIKIMKNSAPVVSDAYIKIQKTKTAYQCGDTLNIDDLTVTYYDNDGTAKTVTDYTTNADEIDMSIEGIKTLIVSYKGQTASVDLTVSAVTDLDKETYTVTFDLQGHGTELEEYLTYTEIKKGSGIKPPTAPQADGYEFTGWYKDADCQTLWDFEKDIIEKDTILYAGWKQSEKVEKKPLVNSVLFPRQKNEYSAVYTGEQIRPVMIVAHQYTDGNGKAKTQKLKLNVDYTVRYNDNVNVGEDTAQVTVRGIGEYTGTITKRYTIKQKSISNVAISPVGDIVFGDEPSVRVTDGTKELVEGRDYNIHLSTTGSADADTQSVLTVEGIGNYTGTSKKNVKFNILKTETDIQPITSENIRLAFKKLPAKGYTYNGKAQKPGVVVTDITTGKKIPSSMYKVIYSNNIAAGKGTAKVWVIGVSKNGKGYYGKSKALSFDIKQKDFSKVSASLSGTIPKTGNIEDVKKAVKEAIIVKDAKHILSENEYTIDYGGIKTIDDIKIGKKYPILLRANAGGNYIETSEKKVNIKFGQLNLASRTANVSVEITNVLQNEILFYYNGILLEKDKDYTATVKKEKNKKTYTVKVKAVKDSAYKGSRTFKNVPSDQEDGDDIIDPNIKPAVSNNKNAQNYRWSNNYNWNWADTVKSYLYENQVGGLTRVEYINGKIVAEDYNNSFKLCASRTIPMELPIWGGFYAGENYNFIIFGQENPSEDDNKEVVRVVKYSKDWKRLGEVGLCGANTIKPFSYGSLRCTEYGDYLYIRTCHEMYQSSDGLNHQANMTIAVRQSDMVITDSFYEVEYNCVGYASHSFNQFILVDQNRNLVTLDHCDAYPRGILLTRPETAKAGDDELIGWFEDSQLVTFPGTIGDNYTGASVGGFAETENGYITAFNYDGNSDGGSRAVYLGYTSKGALESKVTPITEYNGMLTPVLAPVGLDGGYLMWTDSKNKFYYAKYEDGGTIGTVITANASLSDCQPILHNGEIVWYVTQKSVPTFYRLEVSSGNISKIVAK